MRDTHYVIFGQHFLLPPLKNNNQLFSWGGKRLCNVCRAYHDIGMDLQKTIRTTFKKDSPNAKEIF